MAKYFESLNVILLSFLCHHVLVYALQCYHCDSTNQRGCESTEILKNCSGSEDACLSIAYEKEVITRKNNGTVTNQFYLKKCTTYSRCELFCPTLTELYHKNCRVCKFSIDIPQPHFIFKQNNKNLFIYLCIYLFSCLFI